jgi:GNAT superfamily N-acetyltransferase
MSQEHIFPTPIGTITIVQAQPSDLATITDILEEAASWITSLDIDQWRPGDFRQSDSQSRIAHNINRGGAYLALYNGQAIGTITIQAGGVLDEKLWGHERVHDALYVHRLTVQRKYTGEGIGNILLRWAEQLAEDAGKTFLRLDCMADNSALCTYYERYGFSCRGIIGQKWKARLYEKSVS